MRKLLINTLQGQTWDSKDRDKTKAWVKDIGERVKERMLGLSPLASSDLFRALILEFCRDSATWI